MIWLEMSRDKEHGGGDWGFKKCIWSPSRTKAGHKWPYWEAVLQVQSGDTIIHLSGRGKDARFVGYSIVFGDGHETDEKPPHPGQWSYANRFYRAYLHDYVEFPQQVRLKDVFRIKNLEFEEYFDANKAKLEEHKDRLFFVRQSGRLQCLNGAYLSPIRSELVEIIFGNGDSLFHVSDETNTESFIKSSVLTGERAAQIVSRSGQESFSSMVKSNYMYRCCFPECEVTDNRFLVGAHIARWADSVQRRGDINNGLCLCLMHDKAFEAGYFTLNHQYKIVVNEEKISDCSWCQNHIKPFADRPINPSKILPSIEALQEHWKRNNISEL